MSEIHNQREIEHLQSEVARLEHEKRSAALDWMVAAGQYEDEIARLRAGGCARDQGTTQYCAEAAALAAENAKLRAAVEEIYKSSHQVHIIEIARAALGGDND